jgi:hypothetical protein
MSEMNPEAMLPVPELEPIDQEETYTFMAVVDGVVITGFRVNPRAAYALDNNPVFVQVPNYSRIPNGSIWDGQNFIIKTEN